MLLLPQTHGDTEESHLCVSVSLWLETNGIALDNIPDGPYSDAKVRTSGQ